jgi:hypothetical protein
MHIIIALAAGLVFGRGRIVFGMTDPAKVTGFLALAGALDPSLGLVMGGAILVGLVAFRLAAGRYKSLLGDAIRLPMATRIDRRLVLGGLTFGAGWGPSGYCPGPALASLAGGGSKPLIFSAAMVVDDCGRTDFQGGSSAALYDSAVGERFALPDTTRMWHGHDYKGQSVSTIGWKKRHNAHSPTAAGRTSPG